MIDEGTKFLTGTTGIVLSIIDWNTVATISGAILSLVMTTWYVYNIICKIKDRKNGKT